jgi:hypothetical protein
LPFFPGAEACPLPLPDWFAWLFLWSLDCASARLGRSANIIVARTLPFIGVSSETLGVPRLKQLNTGRGAFDPELIASLFRLGDVRTAAELFEKTTAWRMTAPSARASVRPAAPMGSSASRRVARLPAI